MPDRGEALPVIWSIAGALLLTQSQTIATSYGIGLGYAAFALGIFCLVLGPIAQGFFYELYANRHDAIGASIEPWMNGKRTIFIDQVEKSYRIPNPDNPDVPRFRSIVKLARPYFRHPSLGIQKELHVEHNLGLGNRFRFRHGKGNFLGMSVILRGVDGNVVLSEHPTYESEDFGTMPVYDLRRAGWDWAIENGDMMPEELTAVEIEHEKKPSIEDKTKEVPPVPENPNTGWRLDYEQ